MPRFPYLFEPKYSLEPNKCSIYNEVSYYHAGTDAYYSKAELPKCARLKKLLKPSSQVTRSFHNYTLSDNATRTLRSKINWLYYLSKPRTITTNSGKKIYNFRCAFITITLPSIQQHPTNFISSTILNELFTELRTRTALTNYVWRLEFQQNGNAHYHIITDTYISHGFILKIWNRILKYHGYVQPYAEKMSKLTLSEYIKIYNKDEKTSYQTIARRYAKGCRENWEQPPSVDCRSVQSKHAIQAYLSKYFSKKQGFSTACSCMDTYENAKHLRLWFCSRSLSKLKSIKGYLNDNGHKLLALLSWSPEFKKVSYKYATSVYYEIKTMHGNALNWINRIFFRYAKTCNYQACTAINYNTLQINLPLQPT